jgi:cellulose synthase/poly-beta-1,6-N-acetylglucosamine synthase-like glycosyltransferase
VSFGNVLALGLFVLGLPLLVVCGYLGILALLSWPAKSVAHSAAPTHRFDIVVPAHNESMGIAATVQNLVSLAYPTSYRRVIVVADNCTDDTAVKAREAGATVLERMDTERRGKGYALEHAFAFCIKDGFADAVCVVDADTVVSPNLLSAFSARLSRGALAMQAHYGVSNPNASWRTRLMRIALAMFHQVRSTARERLGVSCGLRGNGMCFAVSLLKAVPHDAFSIVEDLEYGVRLGRQGYRVVWVPEADVLGEMVSGAAASTSQRRRWEHGRAHMARTLGWPLLGESMRARSGLLFDLALDVLVPPLSRIAGVTLVGLGACAVIGLLFPEASWVVWPSAIFSLCSFFLCLYVGAGWLHSRTGVRGLFDLALSPAYVLWKIMLALSGKSTKKPQTWVRTTREGETRR